MYIKCNLIDTPAIFYHTITVHISSYQKKCYYVKDLFEEEENGKTETWSEKTHMPTKNVYSNN